MALKSFRDRNPIVLGTVSLITIALAVVVTFLTGTLGLLEGGYTVSGVFAETGGLRSGDDVRVAGVRVGEVTKVHPDFRQSRVIVSWKVDGKVKLGRSTRAEISTANLLGGRYVRLSGPVAPPYLDDLPASARRIPLDRTQTPVTIGDSLKSTTRAVSRLDTKAIGRIVDQLNGLTAHRRGRLGHALKNLSALAETVNENDPKLRELLSSGERIMTLASAKDRELSQVVSSAKVLLDQLRARRVQLATLLGDGSQAVQALSRLIGEHQSGLTRVIDDLNVTMQTLGPQTAGMNTTLAFAGPTATGLSHIGDYGSWLEGAFTQIGPLTPEVLDDLLGNRKPGGRP